jgi:hypothetical protein
VVFGRYTVTNEVVVGVFVRFRAASAAVFKIKQLQDFSLSLY